MAGGEGFTAFLREQLAPMGDVAMRRMFGAIDVFHHGLMFGIVADDTLYLRIDQESVAPFQDIAGAAPLTYVRQGRVIDLPFRRVPDRLMDEPDALLARARAALVAARQVAARTAARPSVRRRKGGAAATARPAPDRGR